MVMMRLAKEDMVVKGEGKVVALTILAIFLAVLVIFLVILAVAGARKKAPRPADQTFVTI